MQVMKINNIINKYLQNSLYTTTNIFEPCNQIGSLPLLYFLFSKFRGFST